ncbi:MAG: 4-hydroxy-tetrahydrodipicolinate synthase [Gammaproteobacteria bacterium]|nr:4-hydroxy-tetrahydrodipicolinate synthase [Gammaproteobacteria bacterium]
MLTGSLVALITPFHNDELDEDALRRLVRWHIEQGTHGIVAVGTTGESATLTEKEHCRVIELVVEEAAGRLPVVAGAGSNNTREAIFYGESAQDLGADATLHVAGYYNRPSQEGLFRHFEAVHEASSIPIIVYNIPPRAIVDISPETMARIAALPRVAGVKDATGDLTRPIRERLLIDGDFVFLSGEDGTAVSYNVAGGNGCISVTANVAPALCSRLQNACTNGDYTTAAAIQERLMPLHLALFDEPSPAGIKYAVSLLDRCEDNCRLPIVPLTKSTRHAIRGAMEILELIED